MHRNGGYLESDFSKEHPARAPYFPLSALPSLLLSRTMPAACDTAFSVPRCTELANTYRPRPSPCSKILPDP